MATVKQPTINDFFEACDKLNEKISVYTINIIKHYKYFQHGLLFLPNEDNGYNMPDYYLSIEAYIKAFPSIFDEKSLFIFNLKETFSMSTIFQFYTKHKTILVSVINESNGFYSLYEEESAVLKAFYNLKKMIQDKTTEDKFKKYLLNPENKLACGIFKKIIKFYESLENNLKKLTTFFNNERPLDALEKETFIKLHLFLETMLNDEYGDIYLGGRNKKSHRRKRVTRRRKQKTTHRRKQKTTHRRKRRAH